MSSCRFNVCLLVAIFLLAFSVTIGRSLRIESVEMRPHLPVMDGAAQKWVPLAPPYLSSAIGVQEVKVELYYRGLGNTALRTTAWGPLGGCFRDGLMLNGKVHPLPVSLGEQKQWCGEITLDLKRWLHPGRNTLVLFTASTRELYSTVFSGIAIGVPLLGGDGIQCMLTLIMLASALALVWLLLRKQGIAWPACLIFVLACADYLAGLYYVPHFTYSIDMERNLSFIQYVSEHFWRTFDYDGPESWNPPLYYWVCALVARALSWVGVFDMWTGIRMISLVSYSVMIYYGMRVMALYLKGRAFYLAFAVLAFWPHGMLCSAWIHSDLPYYAFYAAGFYYLIVWYETGRESALRWALANGGFAFTAKTSALILLGLIGLTALFRFAARTPMRRMDLPAIRCLISGTRSLFTRETCPGWAILAAGVLFNQTKYLYYMTKAHAGLQFTDSVSWGWGLQPMHPKDLVLFNLSDLYNPTNGFETPRGVWELFFITMMFGFMHWPSREVSLYLFPLLLIMLAYIIGFMLTLPRQRIRAMFPVLAGVVVPITASVVYRYVCRTWSCMLFRYIEPSLIAIVLVYILSVQEAHRRNKPALYYGGNLVAILFILFSVIFFQIDVTASH